MSWFHDLRHPDGRSARYLRHERLLASPAIERLANKIGVAEVPCILLDHVDQDLAEFDVIGPAHVKFRFGDELIGGCALPTPFVEGFLHSSLARGGKGELFAVNSIWPKGTRFSVPLHDALKPAVLDGGHVPYQPQKRQLRSRN